MSKTFRRAIGLELTIRERERQKQGGREWLIDESLGLYHEAKEDGKPQDKLQALQFYGKASGSYEDTLTVKGDDNLRTMSLKAAKDEIKQLEETLGKAKKIDYKEIDDGSNDGEGKVSKAETVEEPEGEGRSVLLSD